jgi:hypothetical protein
MTGKPVADEVLETESEHHQQVQGNAQGTTLQRLPYNARQKQWASNGLGPVAGRPQP